jgi:hypothetical protein
MGSFSTPAASQASRTAPRPASPAARVSPAAGFSSGEDPCGLVGESQAPVHPVPLDVLDEGVHVRRGGAEAKFWVRPRVAVAEDQGLDARTLRELARVIADNAALIERVWNEHFA